MKKALIIGSTSVVGKSLAQCLSYNYEVSFAGRKNADYHLDLCSIDFSFPQGLEFDVVIHTAANFGGNNGEDYSKAEAINSIGTLNVCRLSQQVKAKHLVIISSISASYIPGDPYYGIYALTKRHGDELAQLYCSEQNLPLTILRPSGLYDAQSRCRLHQNLFYAIIDHAEKGEEIFIYGNNDALRNYLFLDDFSKIIAKSIQNTTTGLYSCSFPQSVRLYELAKTAIQVFDRGGKVSFLKDKPDIADLPETSSSDLFSRIQFEPTVNLAEGIYKIKTERELK